MVIGLHMDSKVDQSGSNDCKLFYGHGWLDTFHCSILHFYSNLFPFPFKYYQQMKDKSNLFHATNFAIQ